MTIYKEKAKRPQTKFQKLFWSKVWLWSLIEKHSKRRVVARTVRKAQKWETINENSAFEIFASMIELKYFNLSDYTKEELFSLIDKN